MITVKAKFSEGTLIPLESIDLKEGDEVILSISRIPSTEDALRALKASAGGWEGLHDPGEFKRMIYQARIDGSRHTPKP